MKTIALILGLIPAALAQQHRPEFVLGQTLEETHKTFGTSAKYTFETAQNTYKFEPVYELDGSQSRFHPIARIKRVAFELDKPIATANIQTLLADLPEAVTICAKGCEVHNIGSPLNLHALLMVQPTDPSAQELHKAALIGSNWTSQVTPDSRPPLVETIMLSVEGQIITSGFISVERSLLAKSRR
jgi:hypothetical protein